MEEGGFVELEFSLAGGVKELRERLCVRRVWLRRMGLGENAGLCQRRWGNGKLETSLCSELDAGVSVGDGGGPKLRPEWIRRAEGREVGWKRFDWLS